MIYHMLPGDAQVETFKQSGIDGEMLVCRECLVEGDLEGETLDEFFQNRASFMNQAYDEDPSVYNATVASQLRRLTELSDSDEVNLWFEYELFCAANMWFCIDLLSDTGAKLYRVEPIYLANENRWEGFGRATPDQMRESLAARIELTDDDIKVGSALWNAYRMNDNDAMQNLSDQVSPAFPYLKELCEAAIEKDERPAQVLRELQSEGLSDFNDLFIEFRKRAGVYGFGDSQVRRLIT
jgi:hypothetical protein